MEHRFLRGRCSILPGADSSLPHTFSRAGKYGTLYVGVTSSVARRVWEHRAGRVRGFTRRYGVKTLVHYEFHQTMFDAIRREKQIKEWKRLWKIELIESRNPEWCDLFEEWPF